MSYTKGPCPKCGKETVYEEYTPTICYECSRTNNPALIINKVHIKGNRKTRSANKKKR